MTKKWRFLRLALLLLTIIAVYSFSGAFASAGSRVYLLSPTKPPINPTSKPSQPEQPPPTPIPPTFTPTNTPRPLPTATPTPTNTPTPTLTSTPTHTPIPTHTPTPTPTHTPIPTHTPTPTPTPPPGLFETAFQEPPLWLIAIFAGVLGPLVVGGGAALRQMISQRAISSVTASAASESDIASPTGEETPALPTFFIMDGARIMITGPAHSGKSTVLHNFLRRALRDPSFTTRLLLDGKGTRLVSYAQVPGVTYQDAGDLEVWLTLLHAIAHDLPTRYQKLIAENKRKADPGSSRVLVVIDGLESALRDPKFGREIAETLLLVADRPDALADVLIFTIQTDKRQTPKQDVTFKADLLVTMDSEDNPGHFTIQSTLSGPVEATGQARYLESDEDDEVISTLLK